MLSCIAWLASAALAQDPPAPLAIPVPQPAVTPGSLWIESQAQLLAGLDGNARAVGDLITVRIAESARSAVTAGTTTSRSSNVGGGVGSLFGLNKSVTAANSNMGGEIGIEVSGSADYTGQGDTSREGTLEGVLTCQVVEVLPNGNLRVLGRKEVRANREVQYLVLEGVVRLRDIQADNTVESYLLADARIEFTGSGVVSDRQGPGMGSRILDHAWPF